MLYIIVLSRLFQKAIDIGSIFVGYLGKDMIAGLGTDFWGNALFIHPSHLAIIDAEFIPHYIKSTPVIFSIGGGILAFILYNKAPTFLYNLKTSGPGYFLYVFLNRRWLFDKIYNETISQRVLSIGYNTTYKVIDRGLFEFFGPYGISKNIYKTAIDAGSGGSRAYTVQKQSRSIWCLLHCR